MQSELSDLHECLSSADANMRKLQASSVPWIWSLGALASRAKTAPAVLECLQHQLLGQAVADMSKLGAELQSSLPPTDHVANDKTFAKAVANQKLPKPALKDKIGTLVNDFLKCTNRVTSLASDFNIKVVDSEKYGEAFATANLQLASAKSTLTLVAACNVFFTMGNNCEQSEEAAKVLAKELLLPKSVVVVLKSIAANEADSS